MRKPTEKLVPSSSSKNGCKSLVHAAVISGILVGQVTDIGVNRCAYLYKSRYLGTLNKYLTESVPCLSDPRSHDVADMFYHELYRIHRRFAGDNDN